MRLLAAGAATVDAFVGKSIEQGKETGSHSLSCWEPDAWGPECWGKFSLGWHLTVFRAIYATLPSRCLSWCMDMITFAAHTN